MSLNRSYKVATVSNSLEDEEVVVRRRKVIGGGINSIKRQPKHFKHSARRISCVDLGAGSHQGWLYTRKPQKSKWDKCSKWCVIKGTDLFVYEDQRDKVANSRIFLPAFKVRDANKDDKRKGAFKLSNEGTTFYFRCKTDEEKYDWMNFLSLAAIEYPMETVDSGISSRSTGSSSGIEAGSVDSDRLSTYSDADEAAETGADEFDIDEVPIRPKKSSINLPPGRLKSTIDTNDALRKLVTSIREADLDLVGVDKATRRQSQLRKSLAQAGFTRKNSAKNKKVFMLRAKERQIQALEQELSDIEDLFKDQTRVNLCNFLSRYPEYQDALETDLSPLSQSSSGELADYPESIDSELCGASGTCPNFLIGGGRMGTNTPPVRVRTAREHSQANRNTLLDINWGDRQTLIPDFDNIRLSPSEILPARGDLNDNHSPPDRLSGGIPIFRKQKYKQTVTEL